ncbi:hypothetical protein [Virgibacillus sp. DJP39]|uniref:hypothetical protein n=1 Tax=Virgibacillus sp. DJP39 TaxID=3409790 RepID=UPI003BB5F595
MFNDKIDRDDKYDPTLSLAFILLKQLGTKVDELFIRGGIRMNRTKGIMLIGTTLVFCLIVGLTIYDWVRFQRIEGGSIFSMFLALSFFFKILTWDNHDGSDEKDELDRHITTQSAKISYFVLMILSGLILFISEGTGDLNEINNIPLLIVVCLTLVILPITEFVYSRKYR